MWHCLPHFNEQLKFMLVVCRGDEASLYDYKVKEVKNGRLAMLAFLGFNAQYLATGMQPALIALQSALHGEIHNLSLSPQHAMLHVCIYFMACCL